MFQGSSIYDVHMDMEMGDGVEKISVWGYLKGWDRKVDTDMCVRQHTRKNNAHINIFFYGSFPSFGLLETSKLASKLIQRSLVKACAVYHLNGANVLKPKTEEDVKVLQSAQFWRKWSRKLWQKQPILSFLCQHITLQIYIIIKVLMINKVLLVFKIIVSYSLLEILWLTALKFWRLMCFRIFVGFEHNKHVAVKILEFSDILKQSCAS